MSGFSAEELDALSVNAWTVTDPGVARGPARIGVIADYARVFEGE